MIDAEEEMFCVKCLDIDGDQSIPGMELLLWQLRASAQRIFGIEVIFTYRDFDYRTETDILIQFFVPRGHPRVAEVEIWLVNALRLICRLKAETLKEENEWRPEVFCYIYRYSSIAGALAFLSVESEVLRLGEELGHPDLIRLEDLALEEARKAAQGSQ